MASETRTNHRGLSSSHSASVWARLETLLQGRLCLLNCGQQAQQPGTRPWEGGTPGLPGHFPEPCGFIQGQGGQGKGREPWEGSRQHSCERGRPLQLQRPLDPGSFHGSGLCRLFLSVYLGWLRSVCVCWGGHIPAGLERCPECLYPWGSSPLGSGGPRDAFTFNRHRLKP